MTSHHVRPTYAYGPVRIPGLGWLGGPGAWQLVLPSTIALLMIARVAMATGLYRGHWLLVGAVVAAALVLPLARGLALVSRPRIALAPDAQPAWRRVLAADDALRRLRSTRLSGARALRRDVAAARWQIAQLIEDRQRVQAVLRDTELAGYSLEPDDPERLALTDHRAELAARLPELATLIDGRVRRLEELALALGSVNDGIPRSARYRRGGRARRAGVRAQAALAAAEHWRTAADPGAELAEQALAYAEAHRELSTLRPGAPAARAYRDNGRAGTAGWQA